ncbi:metallophosphoesterase [Lederbergia wuyishanensis]|uniref:Phosphoesterase n=1 Tax=Lederbergia wuyishanensis TaxID=1347903 RepID=A0ABU0D1X8_9BACI|nr:metallophosphoesterase [Lederbergia wuyishanensis]MCJ8007022.1 metallophosphoesterase [Lederbergia wuyishanensis]MDQ0342406.1 putative phosphoesterase [Lederbergia wuyishanensis]
MKILVVSDSHGNGTVLENLKVTYKNRVHAMVHCGDSELSANDSVLEGFSIVRGNCDMDPAFPNELVLKLNGSTIFVTHGHLHRIKTSLLTISYRAKEVGADFVFFGHSHLHGSEMIDGTLYLNPGSILLPRGGNEKTYAIITKNFSNITVQYFNEQHEELTQLRTVFQ